MLKQWESRNISLSSWNIYTSQEVTVWAEHGETNWFQVGKGMQQGTCSLLIYSICIILWEAGLEEVKSGFKTDGWNINNPCYASNTVLIAKNAKKLQAPVLHSLSKAHSWCFQQFLVFLSPLGDIFPTKSVVLGGGGGGGKGRRGRHFNLNFC